MAESISQDDIDSLLAELQGSSTGKPRASTNEPPLSSEEVDSLLADGMESDSLASATHPADEDDGFADAVDLEKNLLQEEPAPEEHHEPERTSEPLDDGGLAEASPADEHYSRYDFSNIQIEAADQGSVASQKNKIAPIEAIDQEIAALPTLGAGTGSLEREISKLRETMEAVGRQPGQRSSRFRSALLLVGALFVMLAIAYQTYLLHIFVAGEKSPLAVLRNSFSHKTVVADNAAEHELKSKKKSSMPRVEQIHKISLKEPAKALVKTAPASVAKTKEAVLAAAEAEEGDSVAEEAPATPRASEKIHIFEGFKLLKTGKKSALLLAFDAPIDSAYVQVFTLPNRLVIDLLQSKPRGKKLVSPLRHPLLAKLRVGVQSDSQLRIVVEAKRAIFPPYEVEYSGKGFSIVF